jgi:hypothetical protein
MPSQLPHSAVLAIYDQPPRARGAGSDASKTNPWRVGMTANLNLKAILAEPPGFHEDGKGQLISWLRIDDQTCLELNNRLKPDMKTLETGGGLSTVIFAARECHHTCIIPEQTLADRILAYCRSASIDTSNVSFTISKSCDAIHQLNHSEFDLILIDGCHGFPTVFVDFYYAAKALKLGGVLIVDDMHIYTCNLIARFMNSDPGWKVDLINNRVAFGIKIDDTIDYDWWQQPFVVRRSASLGPMELAKSAMHMLQTYGTRVTAQRIYGSILRRVGLRHQDQGKPQ